MVKSIYEVVRTYYIIGVIHIITVSPKVDVPSIIIETKIAFNPLLMVNSVTASFQSLSFITESFLVVQSLLFITDWVIIVDIIIFVVYATHIQAHQLCNNKCPSQST